MFNLHSAHLSPGANICRSLLPVLKQRSQPTRGSKTNQGYEVVTSNKGTSNPHSRNITHSPQVGATLVMSSDYGALSLPGMFRHPTLVDDANSQHRLGAPNGGQDLGGQVNGATMDLYTIYSG